MANLKLNHIYKVYPNGVKAVSDFTMNIEDKEFIVFVGPSGCGKSTTLRMIAGLEEITAGELQIGDRVVNEVEPKDRDIAMVFQNYALYPHMTVYQNMAFGLKMRKMPKAEINQRVLAAAEVLGITDYLDRKPKAMSGGQRQRVALGRAMVREPKVFLLDEPLSNLDAKLRTSMRSEISKLHKKLQTTFIYVTHDQIEAMTMGTRIVVMKDGVIRQIDSPRNLYRYPENKFVAGFIGTPQMNFFDVTMKLEGDKILITFLGNGETCTVDAASFSKTSKKYFDGEKKIVMGVRAEHISTDVAGKQIVTKCRISHLEELGVDNQAYADINIDTEEPVVSSTTKIIFKVSADSVYQADDVISIAFDKTHIHLFDAETENTISPRIPEGAFVSATVEANKLNMLGGSIKLPKAIALADGEYTVEIPTEALSVGKGFKAKKLSVEDVNGTALIKCDVGGELIYVPVVNQEEDAKATEISCKSIAVNLKLCNFYQNGEMVLAALPHNNEILARIESEKVPKTAEELAEMKGKKGLTKEEKKKYKNLYYFNIDGQRYDCPEKSAKLIVAGGGTGVFGVDLTLSFTPYAAQIVDNTPAEVPVEVTEDVAPVEQAEAVVESAPAAPYGIPAHVEQVLDYGDTCYAKCSVGENTVYIAVPANFDQTDIYFTIDMNDVKVFYKQLDIQFV